MPGRKSYGPGGKWIHDRAHSLMDERKKSSLTERYGEKRGKSIAYAIATQQAHKVKKSPKGFRTPTGVRVAKAKFDKPIKEYKKTAAADVLDPTGERKADFERKLSKVPKKYRHLMTSGYGDSFDGQERKKTASRLLMMPADARGQQRIVRARGSEQINRLRSGGGKFLTPQQLMSFGRASGVSSDNPAMQILSKQAGIAGFFDELDKIAQEMDIGEIAARDVAAARRQRAAKPLVMSRYKPRGGTARKAKQVGKLLGFFRR